MWDPTPWFVGGGAEHSPEVARLLAYAASSGTEGVIDARDLRVSPTAVPGSQIRVGSGACLIRNRAAGGLQQTYGGRNPSDDIVPVASTTSAGARNDLIVARVEDPFMPGEPWADPSDPKVGPYIFSRVIPNVPASAIVNNESAAAYLAAQGYSAIPLAAVSLPVSTTVVTAGHVKDLRAVAMPRRKRVVRVYTPTDVRLSPAAGAARGWFPRTDISIECPEWATRVQMLVTYTGLRFSDSLTGHTRAEYGWATGDVSGQGDTEGLPTIATEYTGLHYTGPGITRETVVIAGDLALPASYRGKPHFVRTGTKINAGSAGQAQADTWTTITVDLEFVEVAD